MSASAAIEQRVGNVCTSRPSILLELCLVLAPQLPAAMGLVYGHAADNCACEAEDDGNEGLRGVGIDRRRRRHV